MSHHGAPCRGVSLVELLVVVGILAIIGSVALVPAPPVTGIRLDAAAREVAAALRFAQTEARRTGIYHGVDFSVDAATGARRVRLFRTNGTSPPTPAYDVRHPLDKHLYDVSLAAGTQTAGVNVVSAAFYYQSAVDTLSRDWLAYDASGMPAYYPDPVVYTAISQTPTISAVTLAAGESRRVLVDPVTGRVSIE